MAIQLRFLQTVVEIAAENNSTTVFPIPMDLFKPIMEAGERYKALGGGAASPGDDSKTLGGKETDDALPTGVDPAMLTDAAQALLGIGSGGASPGEQAVPTAEGAAQSDADGDPQD